MIRTQQLTKWFGPTLAVAGLDLEIKEGEIFGFLGPNGAGKTTTVRMLACLIAPTSGDAWIGGRHLGEDDQAIRSAVGILTESPGLYERLTAAKNLEIFARLYGVEKPAERVEKYLSLLGLSDRAREQVSDFSKGMKQKLAVARALLHEPPLIFLDEPTAGLDPESAKVVRDFIGSLRGQGRTVFLTTHNLDEADRLCDRIAIFKQRLLFIDTPAALRRRLYGQQVRIRLRRLAPEHLAAVQALAQVRKVEARDGSLLIESDVPAEANPAIVSALVAAGAEVQYVEEVEHSLEDAYLSFVHELAAAAQLVK